MFVNQALTSSLNLTLTGKGLNRVSDQPRSEAMTSAVLDRPFPLLLAAGAALMLAMTTPLAPAQAYDGRGAAAAVGAAAGLATGLAIGGALSQPRAPHVNHIDDLGPPAPVYVAPPPPPAPRYVETCRMERQRVWLDSYNYTYRRVEVCE